MLGLLGFGLMWNAWSVQSLRLMGEPSPFVHRGVEHGVERGVVMPILLVRL